MGESRGRNVDAQDRGRLHSCAGGPGTVDLGDDDPRLLRRRLHGLSPQAEWKRSHGRLISRAENNSKAAVIRGGFCLPASLSPYRAAIAAINSTQAAVDETVRTWFHNVQSVR